MRLPRRGGSIGDRPLVTSSLLASLALALAVALLFAALGCTEDRAAPVADAAADVSTTGDAAAGGDATDAAIAGCPTASGPVDPTQLIDDFEDATSQVPPIAGRLGSWFTSGDATPTAVMEPLGLAPPEVIPGGRCGSRHALHVTGSGFLDWGSQVNLALHYGPSPDGGALEELPYDASVRGYQGVTFFARVGDTSTTTVRFAVSDPYSRPESGLCVPDGAPGENCYDTYGVSLAQTLSTQWKQFRIPWTGLSQQDFGRRGGPVPDVARLYDIGFTFPGHVVFDLWIDDISFY